MSLDRQIDNIVPGEYFTLTYEITDSPVDDPIVSASFTIRGRNDTEALLVLDITGTIGESGVVTANDDDTFTLQFIFTEANSGAILATEPYYFWSISYETDSGLQKFPMPIGRLSTVQVLEATDPGP